MRAEHFYCFRATAAVHVPLTPLFLQSPSSFECFQSLSPTHPDPRHLTERILTKRWVRPRQLCSSAEGSERDSAGFEQNESRDVRKFGMIQRIRLAWGSGAPLVGASARWQYDGVII
jgi:hypothetical protein